MYICISQISRSYYWYKLLDWSCRREEEEDWYIVILILHYDCVSNSTCIYRLDGMMMDLQDIHGTKRSLAQCMFWRSVIVRSNRFKPYVLAVTRLYSLGILAWLYEYVLLLNVFDIKCNKLPDLNYDYLIMYLALISLNLPEIIYNTSLISTNSPLAGQNSRVV